MDPSPRVSSGHPSPLPGPEVRRDLSTNSTLVPGLGKVCGDPFPVVEPSPCIFHLTPPSTGPKLKTDTGSVRDIETRQMNRKDTESKG